MRCTDIYVCSFIEVIIFVYGVLVIVITQDEYDILVIAELRGRLRMSVNNKDIIRMYLGYNWLITQKTLSINAFLVSSNKQWLSRSVPIAECA